MTNYEKQYYISQVNNSLEKIYSFLEQLLLWGRIQKDELALNFETCTLKELLSETISLNSETAVKKKVLIDLECDDNLIVILDKEMISIVLRNLISNAIKFSPVGSRIKINAIKENNELKISVVDEGVGIPEDHIPKLFKLDQNISTVGTDGEQGSGMGLILCSDILKKHNGKISVQSKEGRGSMFTIILPSNDK